MQADRELIFFFEFQIFTSPNSSHSIFVYISPDPSCLVYWFIYLWYLNIIMSLTRMAVHI